MPGNAAQMLMGADASPDAVRALTVKLGLDQPLRYRYLQWIKGLLAAISATAMPTARRSRA